MLLLVHEKELEEKEAGSEGDTITTNIIHKM